MVVLKHSVWSTGDVYLEVQYLVHKDYLPFYKEPHIIERFRDLCYNIFTFLIHWNYPQIPITAFCLCGKKTPTREAIHEYQNIISVKYEDTPHLSLTRKAIGT